MSATQPIRNLEDLEKLKNYYLKMEVNLRNYALISTGINTALRISDLLCLKWKKVYNFEVKAFRKHIILTEQKTGKEACIAINRSLQQALSLYLSSLDDVSPEQYIFYGKEPNTHLCRSQAFRIIKKACHELQLPGHISCHSLRKTFGYHAWSTGADPALLMLVFNHSSFSITKRYLGIEQDDKDQLYMNLNL